MEEDVEGAVPAGLTEEELISFYDKNVPPGPPGGPPGAPPPGNFGGGGGNFYCPPGAEASAPPPTASYPTHPQMNLPPYSATDPNTPNSSIGANYAAAADVNGPPPLPVNGPAGSPEKYGFPSSPSEKKDLSKEKMVSADDYLRPEVPQQPPVAAPRSVSPGIPDLPSVPCSFADDMETNQSKDEDVDFDDLTKRFENLKKKK